MGFDAKAWDTAQSEVSNKRLRDRIASLESQIADRNAEIEKRNRTIEYKDQGLFNMACDTNAKGATIIELRAEIERLRANEEANNSHAMATAADNERLAKENAELRADLMWAVENAARIICWIDEDGKPGKSLVTLYSSEEFHVGFEKETIIAAVREARDGS